MARPGALDGETLVVTLMEQLVQHILPPPPPSAPAGHPHGSKLVQFGMALLGSRMSSHAPTEIGTSERLAKKLARGGGTDADALRLRELSVALQQAPDAMAAAHRRSALHVLAELALTAREEEAAWHVGRALGHGLAPGPLAPPDAARAREHASARRASAPEPAGGAADDESFLPSARLAQLDLNAARRADGAGRAWGGGGGVAPKPALAPRAASAAAEERSARRAPPPAAAWRAPSAEPAAERALVREVLYALQAISGTRVRFDASRHTCAVDDALPAPTRALCARLCELGTLYSRCAAFAAERGAGGGLGFAHQGLCAAVRTELDGYFRLLSQLEAERGAEGGLTLRTLLLWAHAPRLRLRTLCVVLARCDGARGGALLNTLGRCAQHGDEVVRATVGALAERMGAPLLGMIEGWLLRGELDDPHAEFFVEAAPDAAAAAAAARPADGAADGGAAYASAPARAVAPGSAEAVWHCAFRLRASMLPDYIPPALATRVLLVGKSVRLLRDCCAERGWVARLRAPRALAWGDAAALAEYTDAVGAAVHARVRELLLEEHGLVEHLRALRQFLLLGQGDFVQHLMDALALELAKPAAELHRHTLLGLVDAAVRASTAASDADALPDCLQRLDVRVRRDPSDEGWAMFSLEYEVSASPISAVLTRGSMRLYRRLFHFLWRLKRAEHALGRVWQQHTTAGHLLAQLRTSAPMRLCQRLRHELLTFVHCLQYYVMFEVLECSWSELMAAIERAPDLDALIAAHSAYLTSIAEEGLFLEHAPFTDPIRAITETVFEFGRTQERLHTELLEHAERMGKRSRDGARNTAAGRWASTDRARIDDATGELALRPLSALFCEQLEELQQLFHEQFDLFLNMVARHPSPKLAFLAARLDFNGFHAGRRAEGQPSEGSRGAWAGGLEDGVPLPTLHAAP